MEGDGVSSIQCVEILSSDGNTPPQQLVFRGSYHDLDLAVKVMMIPEEASEIVTEILSDETKSDLVHQILQVKDYHWVVMKYCDCSIGDAIALLKSITEEEIQAVVWWTLQALDKWHGCESVHGNIKPNNILLFEGQVVLSDQGLGELSVNLHPARLCPEGEHFNDLPPADIWALGVSIIEMIDKVPPYYQLNDKEIEERQKEGAPEITSRASRSSAMNDFVSQCLEVKPERRATIETLINHPWMSQVTEEGAEVCVHNITDRVTNVMNEWHTVNGGHAPMLRVIRTFQQQLSDSKGSVLEDIMPTTLQPPFENLTELPECVQPEKEPEPVVLRDKTAGEFWLSKPDPSLEPQATVITNVTRVDAYIMGPNLSVLVRRMRNGSLMIGPCKGVVRLEGLENVKVSVAARRVEMEACQDVCLTLYTQEPLQLEGCALESLEIEPWNWRYPRQAELMKLASLDPYENRWNEIEINDVNDQGLRLLRDPYALFSEKDFQPEKEELGEQSVFLLKDVKASVRPDEQDCIYISSRKQVRVVRCPGELEGKKNVLLEENSRCEFMFLDCLENVELHNLNACQVVLGPTRKLTLRGLVSCVVIVACKEVKIFGCTEACIFMWSETPPIVISSVLEIAEFNTCWPLLNEQVKKMDFKGKGEHHDIRDGGEEMSDVAKLEAVPYREIPVVDSSGDLIAPMVFPFDDSELERGDEINCDFKPITSRRTGIRNFRSTIGDCEDMRSLTNNSVIPFPKDFLNSSGTAILSINNMLVSRNDGTISGRLVIENVNSSEVLIFDRSESASVKTVMGSKLIIGPVQNVLVIEDCEDTIIVAAASEIIVKRCKNCKLYLWCGDNFVLHASSVELFPFNVVYPKLAEQAVAAFGESRLALPSRHAKVLDLSKNDSRYPEPHYNVYAAADIPQEIITVVGESPSAFPFLPVPTLLLSDLSDSESEPQSPTSPQDVVVKSPNIVSHVSEERVERELNSLNGSAFEIDHAVKSTIIIADVATFVTVSDCSSSEIVIGPTEGIITLKNLVDCKVWCISSSLEVTNLNGCQLHLFCSSPPILHNVTATTLSPFNARLPNLPLLFERAGIDRAVNVFDKPELRSCDVTLPEYKNILPLQNFKLLLRLLEDPVCVPEIEDFLTGKTPEPVVPAPEPALEPVEPVVATSDEPIWRAAVNAALHGEDMKGPWDVAGESRPTPAKWFKSEVTATSVSFFTGKTVVIPESDFKKGQQVELNELVDCRVVVLGSCNNYMIDKCKNCEFVLGPCSAALFIRTCENLCITGACRQLRLYELIDSELFLHVETDPCVESSKDIILRPLNMRMPGLINAFEEAKLKAGENRFHHAADFNTFSNADAVIGFKIPDWVGVLKMRSIAYFGHGSADAPEGVMQILEGASRGGASLEKSSGVYRMGEQGVTAKAAFQQHVVCEAVEVGVQDDDGGNNEEGVNEYRDDDDGDNEGDVDDESDLTLDSDMRSGRSTTKKSNEVEKEAEVASKAGLTVETISDESTQEVPGRLKLFAGRRLAPHADYTLSPLPVGDILSCIPTPYRESLTILHASLVDEFASIKPLVVSTDKGTLFGTLGDMTVEGDCILVQGAVGGTLNIKGYSSRVILDNCENLTVRTDILDTLWVYNCNNCSVFTVCKSLLIGGCVDCNVNTYVTSPPILERCRDITLRQWSQCVTNGMLRPEFRRAVNHYDRPFDLSKPGLASSPSRIISVVESPSFTIDTKTLPDALSPLLKKTFSAFDYNDTNKNATSSSALNSAPEPPAAVQPTPAPAPEPALEPVEPVVATSDEPIWRAAVNAALHGEDMKGPWDVAGESRPTPAKWFKSEVTATSVSFFTGKTVVIPESDFKKGQQVELNELVDCRVVVLGSCNNYMIDKCKNCEFVLGPCSAALFIRTCENLCITGACRQLRLYELIDSELFLHVETDPCVESSKDIILRPLNMRMPGLINAFEEAKLKAGENRFHHAADFNTFSNADAVIGFKIPDWVGVLKMRSIAYFGHGSADAPEGVMQILEGASRGGASLEKSSGVYRMGEQGVTAKAAFQQHVVCEAVDNEDGDNEDCDNDDGDNDDVDDESDLTLDSDMRSGRSTTKKSNEVEKEAEVAANARVNSIPLASEIVEPKVHIDVTNSHQEIASEIIKKLSMPGITVPPSMGEEVASKLQISLKGASVKLERIKSSWKEIETLEETVDALLEEIGINN